MRSLWAGERRVKCSAGSSTRLDGSETRPHTRRERLYGTFDKKRAVCGCALVHQDRGHERTQREEGATHLVAAFDYHAGDGGAHDRGTQRAKIYPRLCDREHGGTQAGRIQFHAPVQRALHEGGHGDGGKAGWTAGWSGSNHPFCPIGAEGIDFRCTLRDTTPASSQELRTDYGISSGSTVHAGVAAEGAAGS